MKTVTLSSNTSWYLYNFRASTIRALLGRGFRVVCLSPEDEYSGKLVAIGCEWIALPMDNKGSNVANDARLVMRLAGHYRTLKPVAAFHFTIKNNIYGTWAATLNGIPAVNNVSGLGTAFIHKGLVSTMVRLLYRMSQPLAHRVFCQNEEDFQLLSESRLVPPERLGVLPGSGVDLQRFHPGLRSPSPGVFRFLYAGRMLADKGLHELLEAVSAINGEGVRCELWLCGFAGVENVSAISPELLEAWSARAGVRWLGPSERIEQVYSQADCVVLPSYREGMPRSLLEAGAMGLPVVATNVPGCRNIVTDGYNGLLCEAKSSESLRKALEAMLALSPEARRRMGAAGRRQVEQAYDEQLVVKAALDVLDRLR
jgi:glycosyltransferase involved in cell wall biosynthesis